MPSNYDIRNYVDRLDEADPEETQVSLTAMRKSNNPEAVEFANAYTEARLALERVPNTKEWSITKEWNAFSTELPPEMSYLPKEKRFEMLSGLLEKQQKVGEQATTEAYWDAFIGELGQQAFKRIDLGHPVNTAMTLLNDFPGRPWEFVVGAAQETFKIKLHGWREAMGFDFSKLRATYHLDLSAPIKVITDIWGKEEDFKYFINLSEDALKPFDVQPGLATTALAFFVSAMNPLDPAAAGMAKAAVAKGTKATGMNKAFKALVETNAAKMLAQNKIIRQVSAGLNMPVDDVGKRVKSMFTKIRHEMSYDRQLGKVNIAKTKSIIERISLEEKIPFEEAKKLVMFHTEQPYDKFYKNLRKYAPKMPSYEGYVKRTKNPGKMIVQMNHKLKKIEGMLDWANNAGIPDYVVDHFNSQYIDLVRENTRNLGAYIDGIPLNKPYLENGVVRFTTETEEMGKLLTKKLKPYIDIVQEGSPEPFKAKKYLGLPIEITEYNIVDKIPKKGINPLIDDAAALVSEQGELFRAMELNQNIKSPLLDSEINYVRRVANPEFLEGLEKAGFKLEDAYKNMSSYTINPKSHLQRKFFPDLSVNEVNKIVESMVSSGYLPETVKNIPMFLEDPLISLWTRGEEARKAVARAKMFNIAKMRWEDGGLARSIDNSEGLYELWKDGKQNNVALITKKLMEQVDIKNEGFFMLDEAKMRFEQMPASSVMEKIAEVSIDGTKPMPFIMDRIGVKAVNKFSEFISNPTPKILAGKWFQGMTRRYKAVLLAAPSWHKLNVIANMIDMAFSGVGLKDMRDSYRFTTASNKFMKYGDDSFLKKITIDTPTGRLNGLDVWHGMMKENALDAGLFHSNMPDYLYDSLVQPKAHSNLVKVLKQVDVTDPKHYLHKFNYWLGGMEDNLARSATYINQVRKGATASNAAKHVIKTFFDYGDMPLWTQGILGRNGLFPFITWNAKNVAKYSVKYATDPKLYMIRDRLQRAIKSRSDEKIKKYMTDWMLESEGIPINFDKKTGDFEITMFDRQLPWGALEELSTSVRNILKGDFRKTVPVTMLNPVVSLASALMFDVDPYTGKKLDPNDMYGDPIFGGLLRVKPKYAHAVHQIRFLKMIDRIATRKSDVPLWEAVSKELWGGTKMKFNMSELMRMKEGENKAKIQSINRSIKKAFDAGDYDAIKELESKKYEILSGE